MNRLTQVEILAALYPIPDPLNSLEEDLCFRHVDLLAMNDDELKSELYCVEWCLHFRSMRHPWLVQRKERLRTVIHAVRRNE